MRLRKSRVFFFTVLLFAVTFCTAGCAVQTSGIIVSGSVSGMVTYKNGGANGNGDITVTLSCSDSSKGTQTVVTAKDGSYLFSNIEAGIYYIFANDTNSTEKMVKTSVTVSSSEEVKAAPLELTGTGSAYGKVVLDGATSGNSGFIVFIAGTTLMAATSDDGSFTFANIPAGETYAVLVMRGANTLFYKTATVTVRSSTDLGKYELSTDEVNAAAKSFIWKGAYASPDANELLNPVLNWAYFNTTSGCSYIYNGTEWTLLTQKGEKGADGKDGVDGEDGKDGADGKDGIDGKTGKDGVNGINGINGINGKNGDQGTPGKDGVGIIWKGPRLVPPENPELNWAYFNRTDGISYIWDGTTWQIFCMVYTDKIPPSSVLNVTAVERSGSAQLEWQDPDDDDLYGVIIICTEKGKTIPTVESLASLPPSSVLVAPGTEFYLWVNLTAGTSYTFSLYAVDATGNKSPVKTVNCAISTKLQGSMSLNIRPNVTTITNQPITATVTCNTTAPSVTSVRYAAGTQYPLYFIQGNGIQLSQTSGTYSFRIPENGTYTVYAKDSEGRQEIVNQTITNIDTTPPEPVTNLTAGYNAARTSMEVSWKKSVSSDVSKTVLMYSSSAQSITKELSGESQSFSFSCTADNKQYTITIFTVDLASNTSKACSLQTVAAQEPAITNIQLSRARIDSKTADRTITATVTGFNFSLIGTSSFAVQVTGTDRTPYALAIKNDTCATGSFLAPTKEGTYSLHVVYNDSVIGSSEFVVAKPAEVTKVTIDKPAVAAGTGGNAAITITGKNLDLCTTISVALQTSANQESEVVSATGDAQTATATISVPQNEGTYKINVLLDGVTKGTTTLLVYGEPLLSSVGAAVTTMQNCGKTIPLTLYGRNLTAPNAALVLICNGKEYPVTATDSSVTTVPLPVPIATSDSTFPIQVKVNGTISSATGMLLVYSTKSYFNQTQRLVSAISSGTVTIPTAGSAALPRDKTLRNYQIGQYPVTTGLWSTVYRWAILNGYSFTTPFDATDVLAENREPMHMVSWRDCIVWCNAYTEWTNAQNNNSDLVCVYYTNSSCTNPIRTSSASTTVSQTSGSVDQPYIKDANGYRLPTEAEWEYAARGANPTASTWSLTYAGSNTLEKVGWYAGNSGSTIHDVGLVNPNKLDLYDMSGLVWEWTFDWSIQNATHTLRGGCSTSSDVECAVSYRDFDAFPYRANSSFGFRCARSN